jgi:prefoldin subunit 5
MYCDDHKMKKANPSYARFEKILVDLKQKVNRTDGRVDQLDRRFQVIESKIGDIEALTDSMSRTVEEIDRRVIQLKNNEGYGKHVSKVLVVVATLAFLRLLIL